MKLDVKMSGGFFRQTKWHKMGSWVKRKAAVFCGLCVIGELSDGI